MAKLYETVVLVDANMDDTAIEATVKKAEAFLAANAEIVRVDRWGKRKLAYEIQRRTHADYTIFYYHSTKSSLVNEFERAMRLDESILRFLTVVDNPAGLPPLQAPPAESESVIEDLSEKED